MKAKIQRVNDIVTDVTFKCGATDSLTMYHLSDIHIDSPFCDRKLLEKHLKQAEEERAPVLIAGDIFDSMQTHDDPRRRPEEMKAEYHVSHYLDAIVMDAVSLFKKYKLQYIIGMGNHESVILRKLNTGLIDRLVYGLNVEGGDAVGMGYHGYLRLKFNYKNGKTTFRKTVYFHHGKSSNAVVTRGVIQTNRQAVYMHDADLVHTGHLHEAWVLPITRERLAENGEPYSDYQWHMMTPGYKGSGMSTRETFGYGVEKHPAPKPKGCARVEYEYNKDGGVKIQPILMIA